MSPSPSQPKTIRFWIRTLVVVCVLPLWLLTVLVSYLGSQQAQQAQSDAVAQLAESVILAVDSDLAASLMTLQTLATAPMDNDADLARLHQRSQQVLGFSRAFNLFLMRADRQVLFSLDRPWGAEQRRLPVDRLPKVFSEGRPAVSDFFVGAVIPVPVVSAGVPVWRDGAVFARLEMVFSPSRFDALLDKRRLTQGWTALLLDTQGVVVASTRPGPARIGLPAPGRAQILGSAQAQGHYDRTDDGGREWVGHFSRSQTHGWTVAIEAPIDILNAQARRTQLQHAGAAVLLLVVGLALAGVVGRRIAGPIQSLVPPALAIGHGEPAQIEITPLEETRALGEALQRAQHLLQLRESARQAAEASLRDSQSRLRMALAASRIGDWELDLRTDEWRHSPPLDRCFGRAEPLAQASFEGFLAGLHPQDRLALQAAVRTAIEHGGEWQQDCRTRWPDGSEHWLATAGTCVIEGGQPRRVIGVVMDITERKLGEALRLKSLELELQNRQMQEASRHKSEFLANMSHELRTPLNAVIGFAEVLQSGTVAAGSERAGQYLQHIATSGRHLVRMIDDVLDLAKVESGKFEIVAAEFDLADLLREAQSMMLPAAQRKSIALSMELPNDLPRLHLDALRVRQILLNLLSNAVKFTEPGGRVVLRAHARGAEGVRVEVEDTGIGIAEDDQRLLFQPFQQVNAGTGKRHAGTGLGLALSRRLAGLMGGTLDVRSRPGLGSCFHLDLPLALPA